MGRARGRARARGRHPYATIRTEEAPPWLAGIAFGATAAAVAYGVTSFAAPELERVVRVVALVLTLVWAFAWRRARQAP